MEFDGVVESRLIDTTVGRIIFNEAIPQNLGYVDRTNEEEKFQFLMTLYQRRYFKAISTNREAFSPLFQDEKEEITRGM